MLTKNLENKFNEIIQEKINGNNTRLKEYIKKCSKANLIKLINFIDNNYCYSKVDLMNTIKYSLNILE